MMNSSPRNLPRFLPTLTEVVAAPTASLPKASTAPDLEGIVQSVMQRVDLVIERRLAQEVDAMFHALVAEQLPILHERLRLELEQVVREAVSEIMRSRA